MFPVCTGIWRINIGSPLLEKYLAWKIYCMYCTLVHIRWAIDSLNYFEIRNWKVTGTAISLWNRSIIGGRCSGIGSDVVNWPPNPINYSSFHSHFWFLAWFIHHQGSRWINLKHNAMNNNFYLLTTWVYEGDAVLFERFRVRHKRQYDDDQHS